MLFENPTINWNNIRPHNGSQNSGFEELVCQLARAQDFNDAKFTRVGTPDGGVEAYWTFSNGFEYGWQAKYFSAWGNSQWNQIKASFKHSLETHPQLKCYYICTPLDRPDARLPRAKSAMRRWQELESDAKNKGVELVYWGNCELVGLLLQEANQGLRYYWFNERVLSVQWFAEHIERSIKNLGARYTPEINIDLPILQQFDIIRRNQNCYIEAKKIFQYSKEWQLIKEWDCISEASRKLKVNSSNISMCAKHIRPFAGGYRWEYSEVDKEVSEQPDLFGFNGE